MSSANFRVRRATLEDLPTLRTLWDSMRFDIQTLEPRLTEFQVIEDAGGQLAGALGFEIAERHGNIHSEAYSDFSLADAARPLLWQRLQALALNHGVARLWTRENAPFWKQQGFEPPDDKARRKLPAALAAEGGEWLTLSLKDEDSIISMEKELALFMEAEKQRTARAFKQARTLKNIATAIAFIFALFVLAGLLYLARRNPAP